MSYKNISNEKLHIVLDALQRHADMDGLVTISQQQLVEELETNKYFIASAERHLADRGDIIKLGISGTPGMQGGGYRTLQLREGLY